MITTAGAKRETKLRSHTSLSVTQVQLMLAPAMLLHQALGSSRRMRFLPPEEARTPLTPEDATPTLSSILTVKCASDSDSWRPAVAVLLP